MADSSLPASEPQQPQIYHPAQTIGEGAASQQSAARGLNGQHHQPPNQHQSRKRQRRDNGSRRPTETHPAYNQAIPREGPPSVYDPQSESIQQPANQEVGNSDIQGNSQKPANALDDSLTKLNHLQYRLTISEESRQSERESYIRKVIRLKDYEQQLQEFQENLQVQEKALQQREEEVQHLEHKALASVESCKVKLAEEVEAVKGDREFLLKQGAILNKREAEMSRLDGVREKRALEREEAIKRRELKVSERDADLKHGERYLELKSETFELLKRDFKIQSQKLSEDHLAVMEHRKLELRAIQESVDADRVALEQRKTELRNIEETVDAKRVGLEQMETHQSRIMAAREKTVKEREEAVQHREKELSERNAEVDERERNLDLRLKSFEALEKDLKTQSLNLAKEQMAVVEQKRGELRLIQESIDAKRAGLEQMESEQCAIHAAREKRVLEREEAIQRREIELSARDAQVKKLERALALQLESFEAREQDLKAQSLKLEEQQEAIKTEKQSIQAERVGLEEREVNHAALHTADTELNLLEANLAEQAIHVTEVLAIKTEQEKPLQAMGAVLDKRQTDQEEKEAALHEKDDFLATRQVTWKKKQLPWTKKKNAWRKNKLIWKRRKRSLRKTLISWREDRVIWKIKRLPLTKKKSS
ncbi:hypothetical protein BDR26DRAFT_182542 [Obelidium mucronatum]|nr:hypothetical protein BDR26DRAFT_182542 [Obelidium mucronatum]